METKQKDKPKNKTVLLFSGGMDSLIFNHLLEPDILLCVPHGNKYEKREIKSLYNLVNKKIIKKDKMRIDDRLYLGDFERDDAIIPNRNLYFITLAAHYGETIYLGSVYGDRSLDKSKKFFSKCENIFNYLYQEQHWCNERKFKIGSPYKDITKTELVKMYLDKGGKASHLKESYSCYKGDKSPCMKCKPCFRKWTALKNNGIDFYKPLFLKTEWFKEILPIIEKGKYRGREDKEIINAIKNEN